MFLETMMLDSTIEHGLQRGIEVRTIIKPVPKIVKPVLDEVF